MGMHIYNTCMLATYFILLLSSSLVLVKGSYPQSL